MDDKEKGTLHQDHKIIIAENTAISIGLVITIVIAVIWISGVSNQTDVNAKEIDTIRHKYSGHVEDTNKSLQTIESKLGVMEGFIRAKTGNKKTP
jgi:hypothetical protein